MSKTVKSGKSKTKLVQDPVNTLFAMGYVDLIFKIKFTDKDLLKTESNSNKTEENKEQEKNKEKSDSYYPINIFYLSRSLNLLRYLNLQCDNMNQIFLCFFLVLYFLRFYLN